jgi:hypothetical protein
MSESIPCFYIRGFELDCFCEGGFGFFVILFIDIEGSPLDVSDGGAFLVGVSCVCVCVCVCVCMCVFFMSIYSNKPWQ